jgi:hypothetical protein
MLEHTRAHLVGPAGSPPLASVLWWQLQQLSSCAFQLRGWWSGCTAQHWVGSALDTPKAAGRVAGDRLVFDTSGSRLTDLSCCQGTPYRSRHTVYSAGVHGHVVPAPAATPGVQYVYGRGLRTASNAAATHWGFQADRPNAQQQQQLVQVGPYGTVLGVPRVSFPGALEHACRHGHVCRRRASSR